MRFRIEFSAEAERDYALIFDHLFESYRSFGTRCALRRRWIIARTASATSAQGPTSWEWRPIAGRVMTICC